MFDCESRLRPRPGSVWQITKSSLSRFGTFRVPARLWQCFSQYACWLEPAIYNEWIRLMQSWRHEYDASVYSNAFDWIDRNRDTHQVRERIGRMAADGWPLACVWSSKKLRMDRYAVDHCFPWSRWLKRQFFIEAEAALPLLSQGDRSLEDTFHAVEFQRARLRASQQLAEWNLGN